MAAMMHSTIITVCASKVISALGLLAKIEGLKFHIDGSLRAVFCCFGNPLQILLSLLHLTLGR